MSLYIGNDDNGKGVFHVTSSAESESDMKSGILPSTVFHNNMQFQNWEIYPIKKIDSGEWHLYYASGFRDTEWAAAFEFEGISTETLYQYSTDPDVTYYFLDSNKQVVASNLKFAKFMYLDRPTWKTRFTTTDYLYFTKVDWRMEFATVYTTTTNVKYIVVLNNSPQTLGDGVSIESGNIEIGGKNLLDFKYVFTNGTLNNHPSSLQVNAYSQLIDASQIEGSLSIESVNGVTVVKKGDYPIILSQSNFGVAGTPVTEIVPHNGYFSESFSEGDAISIEWDTYSTTSLSGKVYVFFEEGLTFGRGYILDPFGSGSSVQRITLTGGRIKAESSVYNAYGYNIGNTYYNTTITVTRYS